MFSDVGYSLHAEYPQMPPVAFENAIYSIFS